VNEGGRLGQDFITLSSDALICGHENEDWPEIYAITSQNIKLKHTPYNVANAVERITAVLNYFGQIHVPIG